MSEDLFDQDQEPRKPQKSLAAFRTISEVSQELEVQQHVLRFWEGRFPQVKPLKRGGGRRYYRPEDVQLLRRIRDLLYKEGYTIRGVQKLLRESGRVAPEDAPAAPAPVARAPAPAKAAREKAPAAAALAEAVTPPREQLVAIRGELERLRGILDTALHPSGRG